MSPQATQMSPTNCHRVTPILLITCRHQHPFFPQQVKWIKFHLLIIDLFHIMCCYVISIRFKIRARHEYIREFGIRDVRYGDYRVVLVGETAIRFLSNRAQESIGSHPEFTERLILTWHYLDVSYQSQSPPPTHLSCLQTPSFIPHPIGLCSELFKLPPCYS